MEFASLSDVFNDGRVDDVGGQSLMLSGTLRRRLFGPLSDRLSQEMKYGYVERCVIYLVECAQRSIIIMN